MKYFVIEIQKLDNDYAYLIHTSEDPDVNQARLKGESQWHTVCAAAAVSGLPVHSAVLISVEGVPLLTKCYKHAPTAQDPEEEQEG